MNDITIDIIQEAYSRFKAHVYYDNFNLSLRAQLAEYENDENLNQNLSRLAAELSKYLNGGELSNRISKLIENSKYIVLPKKFNNSNSSQKKNSILISNQHNEKFHVDSNTILFDGDIELQLIATLWIMIEGVKLDAKIGSDNYGYHLPMHHDKIKLGVDRLLFTQYFKKYQEWRDKGIRAAKHQIDQGNDILLISLDIKNFFHSAHINFKELKKDLNNENDNSLTSLIERICIVHTAKLPEEKRPSDYPILPIGLVSSGVIANWFLCDFDKALKDKMAPIYYGRYVDDFFIVISNIKPDQGNINEVTTDDTITKQTIEWLERRFFFDKKLLIVSNDEKGPTLEFKEKKYFGLKIQASKLKLFYFSPDWPHAMLNKFQKALEENSSAFWFLPDEEELTDSLDDEAYDMQYEDTINKFRSVADVKTSKFGASVFLAKRIKLAILNNGSPNNKITKEIFRFFKGVSILAMYNMWEKVFTYFVVINDLESIKKFHTQIIHALSELDATTMKKELKKTLMNHLNVCLSMSFSLNPLLLEKLSKNNESFKSKKNELNSVLINLRFSLLVRNHYLPLPSIIITDYYLKGIASLMLDGLFDKILASNSKFKINDDIKKEWWRFPHWFRLHDICMLNFILELTKWNENKENIPFSNELIGKDDRITYEDNYIENCLDLFESLNRHKISHDISITPFETYIDTKINEPIIDSKTITINSSGDEIKLSLGLSNMKLDEKELKTAINKKSFISKEKRTKHIKLLNLAEQEKIDLLILPENSVPLEWLYAYADEARRKQRAFIFGLEHFTINNICLNFSIALLPFEVGNIKELLIVPRLKNHYSPSEIDEIKKNGKEIPKHKTSFYHLFKWKNLQFTIYNCYELADVFHRSVFRSELDILFAIEYNKDTNYFSNIAETTCRDLHCFYVQANTSEYGDSRVIEPRDSERMNPVRVKGGENNVILKYQLDIQKLRAFQIQRPPYQKDDKSFKPTPPDFNHEKVEKRNKKN